LFAFLISASVAFLQLASSAAIIRAAAFFLSLPLLLFAVVYFSHLIFLFSSSSFDLTILSGFYLIARISHFIIVLMLFQ
jgi:hypothetical protein